MSKRKVSLGRQIPLEVMKRDGDRKISREVIDTRLPRKDTIEIKSTRTANRHR